MGQWRGGVCRGRIVAAQTATVAGGGLTLHSYRMPTGAWSSHSSSARTPDFPAGDHCAFGDIAYGCFFVHVTKLPGIFFLVDLNQVLVSRCV